MLKLDLCSVCSASLWTAFRFLISPICRGHSSTCCTPGVVLLPFKQCFFWKTKIKSETKINFNKKCMIVWVFMWEKTREEVLFFCIHRWTFCISPPYVVINSGGECSYLHIYISAWNPANHSLSGNKWRERAMWLMKWPRIANWLW